MTSNGDGTWQLKNAASGLCADVQYASTSAGAPLISANSGLAITEAGAGDGAQLPQQPSTADAAQLYTLTKVG